MAWHKNSTSNSEGRIKMGLLKWEAGKEQAAMSPCTSLPSNVMPNTLMGMKSSLGGTTSGRKVR